MTALAAGALSKVSTTDTVQMVLSATATSGTSPYTYQWYQSTTTGFIPSGGNAISGATSLAATVTGLTPGTTYYYLVIATDNATTPATATSSQLSYGTLQPGMGINTFLQAPYLGMVDQRFNYNTRSMEVDTTQSTAMYAGMGVKFQASPTAGGVPKVIQATSKADTVIGFINYDIKSVTYSAGDKIEVSVAGNVIYLYATGAITRGAQVCFDPTSNGGVQATGETAEVVGWAYDGATAAGQLIRVQLTCPTYTTA